MGRQLSQQEIDSYFRASRCKGGAAAGSEVPFDFRRLDRLSKSQISAVRFLHENFVRSINSSLSAYVRSYVSGNLISVEQIPYSEFLEGLPSPTCMLLLAVQPYGGRAVLEVSPSLVFPILDLLLGGKGKPPSSPSREITDIEQSILEGFFRIVAHHLSETWKSVAPISFTATSIESKPLLSQDLAANEAIVASGIDLRVGENSGTMNVGIPAVTLKMMGHNFDRQFAIQMANRPAPDRARMQTLATAVQLDLDVRLCGVTIRVKDLMELQVGDVIDLGEPVEAPLVCTVNGEPKFTGSIQSKGSKRSFMIEEIVDTAPHSGAPSGAEQSPVNLEPEERV